jgi:hypothetical protein
MTMLAAAPNSAPSLAVATHSLERLRLALLWLTAFSGAYVFIEPSP